MVTKGTKAPPMPAAQGGIGDGKNYLDKYKKKKAAKSQQGAC